MKKQMDTHDYIRKLRTISHTMIDAAVTNTKHAHMWLNQPIPGRSRYLRRAGLVHISALVAIELNDLLLQHIEQGEDAATRNAHNVVAKGFESHLDRVHFVLLELTQELRHGFRRNRDEGIMNIFRFDRHALDER